MKGWHDAECGSYTADLALWLELARAERGPVLDVGAGTGRVARRLAAAGHEVVALDVDADLLEDLELPAVVADAQDFDLGRQFGLVIVPMQTVQLLDDRAGFLRCARAHLVDGGLLAVALATDVQPFEDADLAPDGVERDGWTYLSTPVSVRERDGHWEISRVRDAHGPDGEHLRENDVIGLARVTADELTAEAAAAGFTPEGLRRIAPTDDHVGTEVVLLRA